MLTMQIPAVLVTSESPSLRLVGLLVLEQGAGLHPPPWWPLGSARALSRLAPVLWTFLVLRNQCEVWFLEWDHWSWELNRVTKNLKYMYICLHICLYLCERKNLKRIFYWDYQTQDEIKGLSLVSRLEIFATWIKTESSNHKALFESWSRDLQKINWSRLQFDLWTIVIREFQKGMCMCMYVHMSVHTCLCVCSVRVCALNFTFSACAFPSSFVSQRHAPPWGVCVYQSEHVFSHTRHSRGRATVAPRQLEQFPRE